MKRIFNYVISTGLNHSEVIVSKGTYKVILSSKSFHLRHFVTPPPAEDIKEIKYNEKKTNTFLQSNN